MLSHCVGVREPLKLGCLPVAVKVRVARLNLAQISFANIFRAAIRVDAESVVMTGTTRPRRAVGER